MRTAKHAIVQYVEFLQYCDHGFASMPAARQEFFFVLVFLRKIFVNHNAKSYVQPRRLRVYHQGKAIPISTIAN